MISNALLDRNVVEGASLPATPVEKTPLNGGTIENPWPPVNAPNLVRFMFLLHERRGWQPSRQFKSYLREARKVLDKHEGQIVENALRKAAAVSQHPFSFKFVERIIEGERWKLN